MFSQTENPYRNPPKLESKPIPEVSSAELKAKATLLEMLGREKPEDIRRWVMESSYEESLVKDETVLSHVRSRIIGLLKVQGTERPDISLAIALRDLFGNVFTSGAFRESITSAVLDMFPVDKPKSWVGSWELLKLSESFGLLHDPEYLGKLVPIAMSAIRHGDVAYADKIVLDHALPVDSAEFKRLAKNAMEKMFEEGLYPEGFLMRFPELKQDPEIRAAVKMRLRRDLLKSDGTRKVRELLADFGLEDDPDIRRILKLRKAERNIRGDMDTDDVVDQLLQPSEKRETRILALLDTLAKGSFRHWGYRSVNMIREYRDDPRVVQAAREGIGVIGERIQANVLIDTVDVFPVFLQDPKMTDIAKKVVLRHFKYKAPDNYIWASRISKVRILDEAVEQKKEELKVFKEAVRILGYFPILLQDPDIQEAMKKV